MVTTGENHELQLWIATFELQNPAGHRLVPRILRIKITSSIRFVDSGPSAPYMRPLSSHLSRARSGARKTPP